MGHPELPHDHAGMLPAPPGTDSVRKKIATRTPGAEVRVYGKFYANTNAILSSDLREVAVPGA